MKNLNSQVCNPVKNDFLPKLLNSHSVKRLHLSFSREIVQFSPQHLYSLREVELEGSRLKLQSKS